MPVYDNEAQTWRLSHSICCKDTLDMGVLHTGNRPKSHRMVQVLVVVLSTVSISLAAFATMSSILPLHQSFHEVRRHSPKRQIATTGSTGSVVTLRNGSTFAYTNPFGGTWDSQSGSFSARAQSWSPALNEPWDWNTNKTYGVNVGGWLLTEPFITPELYLPYQNSNPRAVDEYTLSQALGDRLGQVLTNHYETFITEQDFAAIAAAGLNWVRIPVPYWAIDTVEGEPYLEGVAWNYMLQAFGESLRQV